LANIAKTLSSEELFRSSKILVPGGVHSGFRYRDPYPIYFNRANGSKVWDIDGNEYLDCLVGNGSCILGHADKAVLKAVHAQLDTGLTVSLESELSIQVAELLHEMVPSAESVKLSNTGSEAVMHAFQIARGYSHRNTIVKTEGCYHGWQDEVHVSIHPKLSEDQRTPSDVSTSPVPESDGYAAAALEGIAVIPYNDAGAFEKYVREHKDQVAALIMEPVLFNSGCILPEPEYLHELYELTQKYGILLIFDEVITGFRLAPGGAQQLYSVTPDISVFGKAIANGFPLSAVVGREDVMRVTSPKTGKVGFSGTYNANQPSLAASKACLEQLRDGKIQKKLSEDSKLLRKRFDEIKEDTGVNALLQSIGGQFQIYFTGDEKVTDYKSAARSNFKNYAIFSESLFRSGLLFHQSYLFHHGTSLAHSPEDMDKITSAFRSALEQVTSPKRSADSLE
jgi:glutamate-1-semialdehyde 2,1-aminomutase